MRRLRLKERKHPTQDRALDFTWIQVVQVPGVGGGRHGWQGERGGPAVGFHQLALDVHVSRGVGLPQGRLERSDLVELDSGQAPGEPRGVVLMDLLVDLSCF